MTNTPITSPLNEADRKTTGAILQSALTDLIDLTLTAKQAHWNVVGSHFRSVHLQLDEVVAIARQYTDDIAERAAAIGCTPDGRVATVAKTTGLPAYPEGWTSDRATIDAMVGILDEIVKRMRMRIDETDKADLVTQDMLIQVTQELEKQRWMWQAMRG
jgi:starvation-inducible DNA-binding protein